MHEGEYKNDKAHGPGTYASPTDGTTYIGNYYSGKRQGEGCIFWADGNYYSGGFADNMMEGYGEYTWADGKTYKGSWHTS